jgi:ribosome-associated toxin RatA of RatAB toxin-antitoxin module
MTGEALNFVVRQSIAASAKNVWAALQQQRGLVSEVEDVREIEVLSIDPVANTSCVKRIVRWRIWLKGFELVWQEEQKIDSQRRRLDFKQIEGMFAVYTGFWQVISEGDQTITELHFNLDSGMPYVKRFIDPVIANALKAFAHELLHGLERLSIAFEATTFDE